jgi:hypothetical protein
LGALAACEEAAKGFMEGTLALDPSVAQRISRPPLNCAPIPWVESSGCCNPDDETGNLAVLSVQLPLRRKNLMKGMQLQVAHGKKFCKAACRNKNADAFTKASPGRIWGLLKNFL